MKYLDVLNEIVDSRQQGESRSDVLTMVHLMEPIVKARSHLASKLERSLRTYRSNETSRTRAARIAGTVLCFLFAPVKHSDYTSAMRDVREKYKGIAGSPALQASFLSALEAAQSRRAFQNFGTVAHILPMELNKAINTSQEGQT